MAADKLPAAGHADDNCSLFKLGGVSMSKLRKHGPCNLLTAAKHNKREIQAEIGYDKKINPALIAKNRCLAGAADAAGVVTLAADAARSAGVDVTKLNKDYCQALELIFSLPRDSGIDEAAYFEQCLRWTGRAFAGLVILSADVHADEERPHPHLHILLSPFKDGTSVSKAAQSSKSKLELGKSFFDAVAGPAGLKRARAKLHGQVKAAAIRAVVKALVAMGQSSLPMWRLTLKAVERDTLQYVQCLGIDLESLRGDISAGSYDLESKGARAYDLREPVDNLGQIVQGHTCDDLGELSTTKHGAAGTQTTPAERTCAALVQGAGADNRNGKAASTATAANLHADVERREVAMAAQAAAMAKHRGTAPAPQAVADDLTHDAGTDSTQAGTGTQTARADRPAVALALTADAATRRQVAHVAAADATRRHANRAPPPPADRGDRITREADADFDVAAWRAA